MFFWLVVVSILTKKWLLCHLIEYFFKFSVGIYSIKLQISDIALAF